MSDRALHVGATRRRKALARRRSGRELSSGFLHGFGEQEKPLSGHLAQQLGKTAEMAQGRAVRDAGLPGDAPQREARQALPIQQVEGDLYESLA
jgi:hypothetical protein